MKSKVFLSMAFVVLAGLGWAAGVRTSDAQDRGFHQPRFGGTERIYNGRNVNPGDAPWAVVLMREGKFVCGGSLVSPGSSSGIDGPVTWRSGDEKPRWVVTAAHCLYDRSGRRYTAKDFTVSTGSLALPVMGNSDGEIVPVRFIMEHEAYDSFSFKNDIALLYLDQHKTPPNSVRRASIGLPETSELDWIQEPYTQLYAQGWGASETDVKEDVLQEVRVPVIDHDYCDRLYRPQGAPLADGMICAGYARGEFDSCSGDSGGPLAYRPIKGQNWIEKARLVGVVSWGLGCAEPHRPGVYSSTVHFKGWLEAKYRRCAADPNSVNCNTKARVAKSNVADRARGNMITGEVVLMPEGCEDSTPRLCRLGAPLRFEQTENLVWQSDVWTSDELQSGTTDGASIPAWAQPIIGKPFDRSYLKAAILHDHYCYAENHVRSWQSVHKMFYDALIASGVSKLKARTMYYAVYLGGARWTKLVPGEDCGVGCLKQRSVAADADPQDWVGPLYDNPDFAAMVAELHAEQAKDGLLSLRDLASRAEAHRAKLIAN